MGDTNSGNPTATATENLWPMGAVTRRTGITEHTLRAWERRFGFPKPTRLASGHRRFTGRQVQKLQLISLALDRGYRAGNVVPLDEADLESLIRTFDDGRTASPEQPVADRWVDSILADALAFRTREIDATITAASASLGVSRFLRDRCIPLGTSLGEAWVAGKIDINHEHFVSQILEGHLRHLTTSLQAAAAPPPVAIACLPDEAHSLGLHMAALEIASSGRQTLVLGLDTPVDQIVAAAVSSDAAAVGLSVSLSADPTNTLESIHQLAVDLPTHINLWLGGGGSLKLESPPERARLMTNLDDLALAVQTLVP